MGPCYGLAFASLASSKSCAHSGLAGTSGSSQYNRQPPTIRNTGRTDQGGDSMTAATRSRKLTQIFLSTALSIALWPGPASAQKQGGSITVGLELDIPGFDPLKVGVFDTAAETAAAAIFDTLVSLDDKGQPQPKLALSWAHS